MHFARNQFRTGSYVIAFERAVPYEVKLTVREEVSSMSQQRELTPLLLLDELLLEELLEELLDELELLEELELLDELEELDPPFSATHRPPAANAVSRSPADGAWPRTTTGICRVVSMELLPAPPSVSAPPSCTGWTR